MFMLSSACCTLKMSCLSAEPTTISSEATEFYAAYRLMNVRSHKIYSDKLRISVLDITHIERDTEIEQLTSELQRLRQLLQSVGITDSQKH